MALDSAGKLLITGFTLSNDFPVTPDAAQPRPGGNGDVFVVRFDPSRPGNDGLLYGTYFGGSGGDSAYAIAADASGGVYLTGYTMSQDFPVTADALRGDYGSGVEVFLARLDLTKSGPAALAYSSYLGTVGIHIGQALATGPNGMVSWAGSPARRISA